MICDNCARKGTTCPVTGDIEEYAASCIHKILKGGK
jgi:hypothetical protein